MRLHNLVQSWMAPGSNVIRIETRCFALNAPNVVLRAALRPQQGRAANDANGFSQRA